MATTTTNDDDDDGQDDNEDITMWGCPVLLTQLGNTRPTAPRNDDDDDWATYGRC